MRRVQSIVLIVCIMASVIANAQTSRRAGAQPKDSLVLTCPLKAGVVERDPQLSPADKTILISSAVDSVVKACFSGKVTTISQEEDGKWQVVYYHQDYWIWYSGIDKVLVKKNQSINSGDAIGINQPGNKIELLIYDFESPLDPRKYLDCGK